MFGGSLIDHDFLKRQMLRLIHIFYSQNTRNYALFKINTQQMFIVLLNILMQLPIIYTGIPDFSKPLRVYERLMLVLVFTNLTQFKKDCHLY